MFYYFLSLLKGTFNDDLLQGKGVYTYEDGSCTSNYSYVIVFSIFNLFRLIVVLNYMSLSIIML